MPHVQKKEFKISERIYEIRVLDTKPGDAVWDMDVDFAPPVGYEEPQRSMPAHPEHQEEEFVKRQDHGGKRL